MKKLIPLAFILCLLFTGCDRDDGSSGPMPAARFVDIAYPGLVPEQVSTSPAWDYARQHADAILVDREPVTGSEAITGIMQNVMSGAADSFTVAQLYSGKSDWWCLSTFTGTAALLEEEFLDFKNLDAIEPVNTYSHNHTVVRYSDYHYINYAPDESFEPAAMQLVNPRDFMPDYDAKQALLEQYVYPLSYFYYADWQDGRLPEGNVVWLFEDLYGLDTDGGPYGRTPWIDYPDGHFPYAAVKETLEKFFRAVPEQRLKANGHYSAAEDMYIYEGGRGGLSPVFYLLDYTEEGSRLSLTYITYDHRTGEPYTGSEDGPRLLVIERQGDGFVFLQNGPAPSEG